MVFAVLLLVLTRLLYDPAHEVFWAGMAFLGFLQVTAVVLNLLPMPGLDGYGALEPHLSARDPARLEPVKRWGFFVLLILLLTPALNQWFFGAVLWFFDLSGVPSELVQRGAGSPGSGPPGSERRLAIYASLRIDCRHGCRPRSQSRRTPGSAGWSSPPRS